jgi:hypothetical protein
MIDYNQFSKISSNVLGLLFTMIGVIAFGVSIMIYLTPIEEPDAKLHAQETLSECLEIAKSYSGFTGKVDVEAKQISIKKYGLTDGKTELLISDNIIARCNSVEVQKFCLGNAEPNDKKQGCSSTGVEMILKYKEPWKYSPQI